jgi:glyoxylase-like metal-dependent hydrolase (beta-lactamase superfamily II)
LIDTGMGIDLIRPLAESLTRLPLRVLLTHSHWDHIGGVHQFERVAVHEAEVAALAEGAPHGSRRLAGLRQQLRAKFFGRPCPPYFDPDRYEIPGFAQPDVLRDGDQIDLGGRRLRVIHTPGHSPGSVCFFDADRRQLFIGDVFYYGPLYCHDFSAYLESTRRLAAMADQVAVVFPSHNELNLFGRPLNGQDLLNLRAGFERIARREAANEALARYEMAEAGYSVLMGFPY